MSLSKTYIKDSPILLDAFMNWSGIHPLAFHDIDLSTCIPNLGLSYGKCQQFNQFNWQGSGVSIELIAEKLNEAYLMAEQLLNFSLQPTFIDEEIDVPKFFRSYLTPNGYLTHETILKTSKSCIKNFGQQKLTKLSNTGVVTYTDSDLDSFKETANVVINLNADVDFSKLDLSMVYITHAGKSGNKQYKIPVKLINYNNSSVTFIGYSWDFIQPELVLNTSFTKNRSLDGCNESFYITNVELWYEEVDSTKPHGYIVYKDSNKNIPFQAQIVNSETGTFRIHIGTIDENGVFKDNKLGLLNIDCGIVSDCDYVSHIKIYYVSNCGNSNIDTIGLSVCQTLLNSVFKLTCCLLPIELCSSCSNLRTVVEHYQTDLAYRFSGSGQSASFNYSYETFMQTWNRSCRGAVEAFRELSEFQNSKCAKIETISNINI